MVCGVNDVPPGGICPAECTGGCHANTCVIDCGAGPCDTVVVCPDGFACEVVCDVQDSCKSKTLRCPSGPYACSVFCWEEHACEFAVIECGEGTCHLDCNDAHHPCKDAQFNCGTQACAATCGDNHKLYVNDCTKACACNDGCTP